ncbi:MAG TPA: hypothetical protein PKE29_05100 [Phycisphaerales bacterium]|nr:hypothetical protein [Phycisphaerales bacterium]
MDTTKTRETARVLNINRGLVWRISRVVWAQDDVTAASNLPGQVGMDRLIEACRARGVDEETLNSARVAVRAFHTVVSEHSGDRKTVEILLANAGHSSTSLDLEGARRAMFEGGCAVWGVRAEVRFRTIFITPSVGDPTHLDQTDIAGYSGFRRLRQVPWPMSYKAVYTDTGAADAPREEPVDEQGANGSSLPLMREFCSPANLNIRVEQTQRATRHELPVMADGHGAPTTVVFGAIHRRIFTARQTPECRTAGALVVMDTPVERVMLDTFVHKSLDMSGPPRVLLVDRLTRPHGYNEDEIENEALPIEASVRRLGPGAAGSVTPHLPWYPRMVERCCARLGFSPDEFVAHRMEMVYPPIPTALVARFHLPAPRE